jgi:hypothetical protein
MASPIESTPRDRHLPVESDFRRGAARQIIEDGDRRITSRKNRSARSQYSPRVGRLRHARPEPWGLVRSRHPRQTGDIDIRDRDPYRTVEAYNSRRKTRARVLGEARVVPMSLRGRGIWDPRCTLRGGFHRPASDGPLQLLHASFEVVPALWRRAAGAAA